MVFSSHFFIYYFLPLALVVYYLSPRRLRHLGLTLLSYLFYGWANPAFVVLMLASTTIDRLTDWRVNLFWTPYRQVDLAAELLWGRAPTRTAARARPCAFNSASCFDSTERGHQCRRNLA